MNNLHLRLYVAAVRGDDGRRAFLVIDEQHHELACALRCAVMEAVASRMRGERSECRAQIETADDAKTVRGGHGWAGQVRSYDQSCAGEFGFDLAGEVGKGAFEIRIGEPGDADAKEYARDQPHP